MIYKLLTDEVKKQLYIVYHEKYTNQDKTIIIERYIAKHPLLKPKLIIINDQVQGFKKINRKIESLEQFPIYVEIQYTIDEDKEKYVTEYHIYTEADIQVQDQLNEIIYLSQKYTNEVRLNRIFLVNENFGKKFENKNTDIS